MTTLLSLLLSAAASVNPAPSQRAVIVALGDSTTAGTPFFRSPMESPPHGSGDAEAPYPAQMMRMRPDWEVVNLGVAGERTDQIRARLDDSVWSRNPRAVIVLAGVNDVYQGRPLGEVQADLLAMYRDAAKRKVPVVAASVLPFTEASASQTKRIRALNAWIAATAKTERLAFCDLAKAAAEPGNPDRLKGSPDGLHPDVATYGAIAEAAAGCVSKLPGLGMLPKKR